MRAAAIAFGSVAGVFLAAGCSSSTCKSATVVCEAMCKREERCGRGTSDCVAVCTRKQEFAKYFEQARCDFLANVSSCMDASSCDDQPNLDGCVQQSWAGATSDPYGDVLLASCLQKRQACKDLAVIIKEDPCYFSVVFNEAARAAVARCTTLGCAEAKTCFEDLGGLWKRTPEAGVDGPPVVKPDGPAKHDRQSVPRDGLWASKDGPVYLDGAIVKPATNCLDKDVEPNNSAATATPITGQGFIPGWEICYPGDIDQYKIKLDLGQRLVVKVKFFHSKGDLDAALVDPSGFVVNASRGEKDDEQVSTTADKAGIYVIGVYGYGAATNSYDLDITITN
jgi:hypothetical protein